MPHGSVAVLTTFGHFCLAVVKDCNTMLKETTKSRGLYLVFYFFPGSSGGEGKRIL